MTDIKPVQIEAPEKVSGSYNDAQKESDKLMLRFMNIAKYIENINDESDNNTSFIDSFLSDNDLSNFNNKRVKFYHQFFRSVNNDPRVIKNVLKVHNYIKGLKKEEREVLKNILQYFQDYKKSKTEPDNKTDKILEEMFKKIEQNDIASIQIGGTKKDYLEKYIGKYSQDNSIERLENKKDNSDPHSEDNSIERLKNKFKDDTDSHSEDNMRGYLRFKYDFDNVNNLNQNIYDKSTKKNIDDNPMQKFIEDYHDAYYKDDNERMNAIKKAVNDLENNPENVLENLQISREDRLVFILTTFFIRYVTMNLIQWCIDINFIKDFYMGFILFAMIYNVIFWLIVMFVNINTLPSVSYMNLKSNMGMIQGLFYYFYMGTNGIMRLITHSVILIIILLIPVIININTKREKEAEGNEFLTMEEKKKLIKILSLLTIFIWIFTSIIAIKF